MPLALCSQVVKLLNTSDLLRSKPLVRVALPASLSVRACVRVGQFIVCCDGGWGGCVYVCFKHGYNVHTQTAGNVFYAMLTLGVFVCCLNKAVLYTHTLTHNTHNTHAHTHTHTHTYSWKHAICFFDWVILSCVCAFCGVFFKLVFSLWCVWSG